MACSSAGTYMRLPKNGAISSAANGAIGLARMYLFPPEQKRLRCVESGTGAHIQELDMGEV
jgi:hypothetical protein